MWRQLDFLSLLWFSAKMVSDTECFFRRTCPLCQVRNCTWVLLRGGKSRCAVSSDGMEGVIGVVEWDGICEDPLCKKTVEVKEFIYKNDAGFTALSVIFGLVVGAAFVLLFFYLKRKWWGSAPAGAAAADDGGNQGEIYVPPMVQHLNRRREREMVDHFAVVEDGEEFVELHRRVRNLGTDRSAQDLAEVEGRLSRLVLEDAPQRVNIFGFANPLYMPSQDVIDDAAVVPVAQVIVPNAPPEQLVNFDDEEDFVGEREEIPVPAHVNRRRNEVAVLIGDLEGVPGFKAVLNGEDLAPRLPRQDV